MKLKQANANNFNGLVTELLNSKRLKRKLESIVKEENERIDSIYLIRTPNRFHLLGFTANTTLQHELFTTDRDIFLDCLYYVNNDNEGSDTIHYKTMHTRVLDLDFFVLLGAADTQQILDSLNIDLSQDIDIFKLANQAIYRNLNEIKSIL